MTSTNQLIAAAQFGQEKSKLRCLEMLISMFLGVAISYGYSWLKTDWYQLGIFMISLSVYHLFEYLFSLFFHFENLHPDNYLINQSKAYVIAMS